MLDSPSRKVDAATAQSADREMSEALSENGLQTGGVLDSFVLLPTAGWEMEHQIAQYGRRLNELEALTREDSPRIGNASQDILRSNGISSDIQGCIE
ncbi:hypothetical protein N7453_012016 [Penicillium expansum]|nr:hypothetical protein N7453_012016 [Penicillium expansum]